MVSKKLIANAESAAAFLALMGNEKRLLIMNYLAEGEMSVGALAEKVLLSQSALSQHLAKLRALDLVETRRDRQMRYYSSKSDAVRELLNYGRWHTARVAPALDGQRMSPKACPWA
ncbi:metalloregulator ArsR/SmtB family transcription factor [Mesorhizobium sp.]|uniref:ArsR/SmtB family transcription factor n=1 Tax=Mesorhizobium sp. TaxID=1871066 RepID=UPI000FE3A1CA|nr:metalloregulator ArsR/SmtB family transcription factor [Mesorhizobium sp.]RWN50876.1 MAG: ArsR family transcriptional regulator [Mesorhizobium sp.]RWN71984.1 MAG: ArsR family transcriptional regulator [Mesorhizobium sp.]RWN72106.1 MAG: ArsR family transcriptional regulator [Mesorhizobium sp.]RWN83799.1 MAG: ArsR family transcriptional regulator [Mesorhizobium sp.]RWO07885.1 MAG: ArsR family transcriptional regulator [Mesorhizobium sp.]